MGVKDSGAQSRHLLPVFFLIDASGDMISTSIIEVNAAMVSLMEFLSEVNCYHPDNDIKVGVLVLDEDARWVTGPDLVDPECYKWFDLEPSGNSVVGSAFEKLNSALSHEHGMICLKSGSFPPIIFLISDSLPTDDYQASLNRLRQNSIYRAASKVAFNLPKGDNAFLQEFTRKPCIIHLQDAKDLEITMRDVIGHLRSGDCRSMPERDFTSTPYLLPDMGINSVDFDFWT